MAIVVQKYGGTSVADADRIKNVARRISQVKDGGDQVVTVVSALGDPTDELIELAYRVALMTEELGEISSCVTKGKDTGKLAEECADLLILVIGTAIAADFDLRQAFWEKMEKIMQRDSRMVNGRIRVSEFRDT